MKKSIKNLIIGTTSVAALLVIGFQNCSPVNFSAIDVSALLKTNLIKPEDYACQSKDAPGLTPMEANRWDWANGSQPTFRQVMASPMVADIDGDAIPEIVFTTYAAATNYNGVGVLRVLSGKDLHEKFSVGGSDQPDLAPIGDSSPLLVSLDGNKQKAQIVYVHYQSKKIIALNSNGSLRWQINLPTSDSFTGQPAILGDCIGGPAAADFSGNGRATVIVENYKIDEDSNGVPHILQIAPYQNTSCTTFAMTINPNDPNSLAVITGSQVIHKNGSVLLNMGLAPTSSRGRRLAAADIDSAHPGIEIAYAQDGVLHVWNVMENAEIWSRPIPTGATTGTSNGNAGGPPAISDFDGDGRPDIAVAGDTSYTVFRSDGSLLWKDSTIHDYSSAITGSTIFDFNGDGVPEILYGDEGYLHFYQGPTSNPFFGKIPNPSHTHLEYPVVVDTDGDGHSEIVVVFNNAVNAAGNWGSPDEAAAINAVGSGLRVFKSASNEAWLPTRKIWNQYSYFVNNVTDSLLAGTFSPAKQDFFRRNVLSEFRDICKD